jgi:hypothetical protein
MQAANVAAGSPSSGAESPASSGAGKTGRAQAKKLFKDEVDRLVQAVKLIPIYAEKFSNLRKNGKLIVSWTDSTTGQPRQYQIGRSEFKEFVSQIVKKMSRLPTLAFTLNKTHRHTAPNSGFLAPARFVQEIVNFFAQADVGPIVRGNFVEKTDKAGNRKMVPDSKSLNMVPNTRLNSVLYFTQLQINGQQNPLYGIISPGTLTPLFALHAYHSQMQNAQDATRLSASQDMRRYLRRVMEVTIQNDVSTISDKYRNDPAVQQQVQQIGQQLLAAIDNPAAVVNSKIGDDEIFNPNNFLYAHFSKLISNGKAQDDSVNNPETRDTAMVSIRQAIPGVYGSGVAGITLQTFQQINEAYQQQVDNARRTGATIPAGPAYEHAVLLAQQKYVALARAYKNQVQGTRQRQRRAQQKATETVATAQQGALPGVGINLGGFGSVQGLSRANIQDLPTVSGIGTTL